MIIVALIVFLGALVQSSIGFGFALVTMPILVGVLGIHLAAPLVALTAMLLEITILLRYREAFNFGVVKHLTIAAIIGIPIGVLAASSIEADVVNKFLGIIVIGYALYALLAPSLPELAGTAWAYFFGLIAGILGGAYNTAGPPIVMYGNARRWPPDEFKSNLQGFFLINGIIVIIVHAAGGNITSDVFRDLIFALPGLALGLAAGFYLSMRINPALFRNIVLVALLFLGASLLIL
ncbi:MAG: TSUP family transporter [Candidatus Promineifilaceae bacterium]|jgi:uncharacterized membrane protein YfcA